VQRLEVAEILLSRLSAVELDNDRLLLFNTFFPSACVTIRKKELRRLLIMYLFYCYPIHGTCYVHYSRWKRAAQCPQYDDFFIRGDEKQADAENYWRLDVCRLTRIIL